MIKLTQDRKNKKQRETKSLKLKKNQCAVIPVNTMLSGISKIYISVNF